MIIFVPKLTARIKYTLDFIFNTGLNIELSITDNKNVFSSSSDKYKITYGHKIDDIPYLPAHSLLTEDDINTELEVKKIENDDIIALFETNTDYSKIEFDLIASTFYLISRYEEYIPCVVDNHGRYSSHQSCAYKYGFVDKLMVNRYILWLDKWLKNHYPDINTEMVKPLDIITIDVDHAFYNQGISLQRKLIRAIKNKGFSQNDPFDNYDYILDVLKGKESIFFFLCNRQTGGKDSFVDRNSEEFIKLTQRIGSQTNIGIHPSYYSEEKQLIKEEKEWLQTHSTHHIDKSRFHFLRYNIDSSFHILNSIGIKDDYSMKYSTDSGWRTSTNIPFHFFDLKKNKALDIIIHSTCIMDSSYKYSDDKRNEEFYGKYKSLKEEVKKYGGEFIALFHNDVLSEEEWKSIFEKCIKLD